MIDPGRAFLMSQECDTSLEALPEQHVLTVFISQFNFWGWNMHRILNSSDYIDTIRNSLSNSTSKITECGNQTRKRLVSVRKWVSVALSIVASIGLSSLSYPFYLKFYSCIRLMVCGRCGVRCSWRWSITPVIRYHVHRTMSTRTFWCTYYYM